ncbi:MAG: Rpp14/Pop5 family protein [Candidatus Thorarchaeota archaeon]
MKTERKRYVQFKLHSEGGVIDEKRLTLIIRKTLLSLYGEITLADSKFFLNEFDPDTGVGVIQCTLPTLERVIASAALIDQIDDTAVSFQPLKTSGTIKGLK